MKYVYFDNAATTRTDERVVKAMLPYFTEDYGNPGSMHQKGLNALQVVHKARKEIAQIIGASTDEIIFTGSGTESNNLAILGFARKNKTKGKHIIISNIEHPAVKNTARHLIDEGFTVTEVAVDKNGIINLNDFRNAIQNDTILASIIYANNEIGVVQNISEISKICHEKNVKLHTDACQAANYLDIDVNNLNIDMMTLNGSKINGPKGVGVLYCRKPIKLEPLIYGGGQENNIRSGTENVPSIVGFAKALEIVTNEKEANTKRMKVLQKKLIDGLLKIPETRLNGDRDKRLPNNVNISFLNIEGEAMLLMMNEMGIAASTGSACSAHDLEPSPVIMALGVTHEIAHGSIRFSLGDESTESDVDYVLEKIPIIVKTLRDMSPMHEKL